MRSRIILLLAVYSNIAAAGPLRHNGARLQHHNVARFLNHTEIPSIPVAIHISTPITISSSSTTPLIAANPETSAIAATSSTIPAATPLKPDVASSSTPAADALTVSTPIKFLSTSTTLPSPLSTTVLSEQSDGGVGATPTAVVQPAVTMSRLFNLGGSPPNYLQSSTNALSFSSTPSSRLGASTPTNPDVQSTFSAPKVSATPPSSSVENQAPSSSEAALSTSSPAVVGQVMSSSETPVTTFSPAGASQAPSPVVVPVPISSGVVQVLGPGGDTVDDFAPVTLDPSSPAPTGTAKYPTAEVGNIAMAVGFNSVYEKLNEDTPCNPGDPNQAYVCVEGELAECQSDKTYAVKSCPRGQSCYALPKPSGLTGIVVQCAVPSIASSILYDQPSSTAVPVAVTSQPAQELQAEGDASQATQSVSAQNPVQPTIQSQVIAPSSSVPAVTTAAQQVNPLNSSPKSEATPSASPTTATDANPIVSVPKALFAVVTASVNDRVSSNGNSAQASLPTSPEISTPATQSSALSPQISPDSPAPTGVPVNEKLAGGNGQATVTVTVTVTTTERTPPVTIISS